MSTTEEFEKRLQSLRKEGKASEECLPLLHVIESMCSSWWSLAMSMTNYPAVAEECVKQAVTYCGVSGEIDVLNPVDVCIVHDEAAEGETYVKVCGRRLYDAEDSYLIASEDKSILAFYDGGYIPAIAIRVSIPCGDTKIGVKVLEFELNDTGLYPLRRVTYIEEGTNKPLSVVMYKGAEIDEIVSYGCGHRLPLVLGSASLIQAGFSIPYIPESGNHEKIELSCPDDESAKLVKEFASVMAQAREEARRSK